MDVSCFCCLNEECRDYGVRDGGNLSPCGWSGKSKRIRMIRCSTCEDRFSERRGTPFFQAKLSDEKVETVLQHVQEGVGVRQTARLVGVNKDTVTRYTRIAGEHAEDLHDELVAFSPRDKGGPAR